MDESTEIKYLHCGCCTARFLARQSYQHDQHFGLCRLCIQSEIDSKPFGRAIPKERITELQNITSQQFPDWKPDFLSIKT